MMAVLGYLLGLRKGCHLVTPSYNPSSIFCPLLCIRGIGEEGVEL